MDTFTAARALVLLPLFAFPAIAAAPLPRCTFPERRIVVDGDAADWAGIPPQHVHGASRLWFGQGMAPEMWSGDADLSYQWRGAWDGDRLACLFEVTDDRYLPPSQSSTYLCDCVEIYIDPACRGGPRVQVLDGREDWFDRCDTNELRGYEIHFLPGSPIGVYLDHSDKYRVDRPQTERYRREWAGEAVAFRTAAGYVLELAFRVPGFRPALGREVGIEVGVCDDDGRSIGRESILMWTGTRTDFWLTMDGYGTALMAGPAAGGAVDSRFDLGPMGGGSRARAVRGEGGTWGIAVENAGLAWAAAAAPAAVAWVPGTAEGEPTTIRAGYASFERTGGEAVGLASLPLPGTDARIDFVDRWRVEDDALIVRREVVVRGEAVGAFATDVAFALGADPGPRDARLFVPGTIYGGPEDLSERAIGGTLSLRGDRFDLWTREDRLPAPLVGFLFPDGRSVTVLDRRPLGTTVVADGFSVRPGVLVDERIALASLGAARDASGTWIGFRFPAAEGSVTYSGDTYPGGQIEGWRRLYHPARDGARQAYEAGFRFGLESSFPAYCRGAWRWAWRTLQPSAPVQDIAAARRSISDLLAARVVEAGGRAGIPNYIDAVHPDAGDEKAVLGFTGKNLEAAEMLLREAALDGTDRGARMRRLAEAVIASFLRLKVAPPEGEGFSLKDGRPVCAIGDREVFLRSFGDDVKALLRAHRRERAAGRDRPDWLAWCRSFADWLLMQQRPDGGFPRSWRPKTGEIASPSPLSSYTAVPLLVLLGEATGERRYVDAAVLAGECCWASRQAAGRFVGGTIDNPDVLDKEAGTLSLEAWLALFDATGDRRWLDRAAAAADYAETWVYLWNVPMPIDADDARLHWKRGVATTGLQLISTGHSLVDAYMAFDADEYARLWRLTGDAHYREVARLLLHGTKGMLALPGRTYDLAGPGWQQEHWSLAPRRGIGLHRGWLPWVATSQLNGIFGLMEADPALYEELATER